MEKKKQTYVAPSAKVVETEIAPLMADSGSSSGSGGSGADGEAGKMPWGSKEDSGLSISMEEEESEE